MFFELLFPTITVRNGNDFSSSNEESHQIHIYGYSVCSLCSKGLCYSWYKYDKVLKVLLIIFSYESGEVSNTSRSNRAKKTFSLNVKMFGRTS